MGAPPTSPIVVHIPHASRVVPANPRRQLVLDDDELDRELVRMTDSFTDTLFGLSCSEAERVVFPVSRLIVDPERFESDADEPMSKCGMGVIYTLTSLGEALRHPPSVAEREALLDCYYRPHHASLSKTVEDRLNGLGRCLLIDAHSFPSAPRPYELDQDRSGVTSAWAQTRFTRPLAYRKGL